MHGHISFQRIALSKGTSSDCNCPFLTVDAKSLREEGFLHPACPHRARTHTSLIYHHAIVTCQLDNDFPLGISRLEMLFRLQKQLHVFSFLSCVGLQACKWKGCNLPRLQLVPQPSMPTETHTDRGITVPECCVVWCCGHCDLYLLWYWWFKSLSYCRVLQKAIFSSL